jgi:hypothetical protein
MMSRGRVVLNQEVENEEMRRGIHASYHSSKLIIWKGITNEGERAGKSSVSGMRKPYSMFKQPAVADCDDHASPKG